MYSHKLYVNSLKVILKVYTTNEEHLTNNSMVFRFSLFCAPNSVKMIFSNQIIGVLINFRDRVKVAATGQKSQRLKT